MKKSRTRAAPSRVAIDASPSAAGSGTVERPGSLSREERERLIAEAAYHRAQQRGFVGGDPVEDWLAAEREIDQAPDGRPQRNA